MNLISFVRRYGRRQSHVLREREREQQPVSSTSSEKSTATNEPIYCTVKDDISKSITPTPSPLTATGIFIALRLIYFQVSKAGSHVLALNRTWEKVSIFFYIIIITGPESIGVESRNSFGKSSVGQNSFGKASVTSFGKTSTGNSFGKASVGCGSTYRLVLQIMAMVVIINDDGYKNSVISQSCLQ